MTQKDLLADHVYANLNSRTELTLPLRVRKKAPRFYGIFMVIQVTRLRDDEYQDGAGTAHNG